jgi:hypothetical protein
VGRGAVLVAELPLNVSVGSWVQSSTTDAIRKLSCISICILRYSIPVIAYIHSRLEIVSMH